MEKLKVIDRKVVYGLNTGIKYIKTDGRNKNYIYVQHKHKDYELRLITKGRGICMLRESVVEYNKGDILFFGYNVPHCSSIHEASEDENLLVKSIVLQFHPNLFPQNIHDLHNYRYIHNLFERSQNGLIFKSYIDPKNKSVH